ncbi:MAG: c-type cytochrome [Caldilineaceae bacterium]|nr:c-type cytochrome [Caldilineaceae bacterium]HRJ40699.1 c-type cytochrome [Caldilineaceae bacterium]
MGSLHSNRFYLLTASLLVVIFVLAACAPNPRAQLISPDMVPEVKGQAFVPPIPTPIPDINTLTDEEIYAGLAADVAALLPGDPVNGEQVATSAGCVGCHRLDNSNDVVAPTWGNVASTAITRVQGESPALYLYTSITAPNAFVTNGYNGGVMPQTYKDILSAQDIVDIVAYLLTQRGQ